MSEDKASITVFIAEDHQITRLGLKYLLDTIAGVTLIGMAEDGIKAVSGVKDLKPQVVLMDIGMPGKDGIAATQEIKAILPETKVVMFTSRESQEDIFAAFASGADGYCLKDSTPEQLETAIASVAKGATWLHPAIARHVLGALQERPKASGVSEVSLVAPLSDRELEVLKLVVDGLSNQEIADRLILSIETVKTHMRHIMEKLSVADRTQAAVKALRAGLV